MSNRKTALVMRTPVLIATFFLAALVLPGSALAKRVPFTQSEVQPGQYVQAARIELDNGLVADKCYARVEVHGMAYGGVLGDVPSDIFPGEISGPCDWYVPDQAPATAQDQVSPDVAPAPEGPPPPQRRLLPKEGGFFAKGETVDAFAIVFTDKSFAPNGPCFYLVAPKDGWGYDGTANSWPGELADPNKHACADPVMPTGVAAAPAPQIDPASPPPAPPAPAATQQGPQRDTTGDGQKKTWPAGSKALGAFLQLKDGRTASDCVTSSAPQEVTVTSGVLNPTDQDLASIHHGECQFGTSSGGQAQPAASGTVGPNGCVTVNCLPRRDDPNSAGIRFKAGEAVDGAWVTYDNGRKPGHCYTKEAPSSGTVIAGVVNYTWDEWNQRVQNDSQC